MMGEEKPVGWITTDELNFLCKGTYRQATVRNYCDETGIEPLYARLHVQTSEVCC